MSTQRQHVLRMRAHFQQDELASRSGKQEMVRAREWPWKPHRIFWRSPFSGSKICSPCFFNGLIPVGEWKNGDSSCFGDLLSVVWSIAQHTRMTPKILGVVEVHMEEEKSRTRLSVSGVHRKTFGFWGHPNVIGVRRMTCDAKTTGAHDPQMWLKPTSKIVPGYGDQVVHGFLNTYPAPISSSNQDMCQW